MGDHYVPRAYLRGFCEKGTEMIFAYEKGSRRSFRTNIVNVAQERNYYPKDVEKRLANEVEDPSNEVIRRIQAARENISREDKVTLAYYMATMMKRVPRHRQRLKALIPEVLDDTFNKFYSQMAAAREIFPQYSENIEHHLGRARELEDRYKKALPQDLVTEIQAPWPSPDVVASISSMTWRFGFSGGPSYFLANDNPLFFFEGWGVGSENSEITFPLSSAVVLHANLQTGADMIYLDLVQDLVKEVNRRSAFYATRFLFYYREEEWVKTLAQKKRDVRELSRIAWPA